jgi:hypothetical protein
MITQVPIRPGPSIENSRIGIVQGFLKVPFREVTQGRPNLAECTVDHQVREKKLSVLERILRPLEPHDATRNFLKFRIHV